MLTWDFFAAAAAAAGNAAAAAAAAAAPPHPPFPFTLTEQETFKPLPEFLLHATTLHFFAINLAGEGCNEQA